jgi:hypothetical protein
MHEILYLWQGREWPFVLGDAAHPGWWRPLCVPVAPECQLKRMVAKFHCAVSTYHDYAGLHKTPKTLHRETETRGSITVACVDNVQKYLSQWPWETWAFIIYACMLCFYLFDYCTEYVTLPCVGWTHSDNTGQQILIPPLPNSVAPKMLNSINMTVCVFWIHFTSLHCNTTVKEVYCQWHIASHHPVGWGH